MLSQMDTAELEELHQMLAQNGNEESMKWW